MKCPYCGENETKVTDSREIEDQTRRRRECTKCEKRFTTYEKVEKIDLIVIKKDGSKEPFDKSKIKNSVVKACSKRPVTIEQIDDLADEVEYTIKSMKTIEVPSKKIGTEVIKRLAKLDKVAYLRFVSVYKNFDNIEEFAKEIEKIS